MCRSLHWGQQLSCASRDSLLAASPSTHPSPWPVPHCWRAVCHVYYQSLWKWNIFWTLGTHCWSIEVLVMILQCLEILLSLALPFKWLWPNSVLYQPRHQAPPSFSMLQHWKSGDIASAIQQCLYCYFNITEREKWLGQPNQGPPMKHYISS